MTGKLENLNEKDQEGRANSFFLKFTFHVKIFFMYFQSYNIQNLRSFLGIIFSKISGKNLKYIFNFIL